MFTGIVEEIGVIKNIKHGAKSSVLTIQGEIIFHDLKIGDSVAVNGVCLTATNCSGNIFTADAVYETLKRSSLGQLHPKAHVNLERAMHAKGRFGGHIVSGHIDRTGIIQRIEKYDNAVLFTVKADVSIMRYIVEKGSVAIDGISLTVADIFNGGFRVFVIPHTAKATILAEKVIGDIVNIENDVVGKYVENLMKFEQSVKPQNSLSKTFLEKYQF